MQLQTDGWCREREEIEQLCPNPHSGGCTGAVVRCSAPPQVEKRRVGIMPNRFGATQMRPRAGRTTPIVECCVCRRGQTDARRVPART